MATLNLDTIIEEPRHRREVHRNGGDVDLDDDSASDKETGGALVGKRKSGSKHKSKPSSGQAKRELPFHELLKALSRSHPYDKYVDDYALKTGRPAHILKHHLQDKYRDHLITKMPDGTPVPKYHPVSNRLSHPATGVKSPPFTHIDMIKNYLSGKPSSLDSANYVVMNGKVVPKSNGNSAFLPVDNGYQLIPRDYYQQTMNRPGPRLVDVNKQQMYAIGTNGPVGLVDQRLETYNANVEAFMKTQLQAHANANGLNMDIVTAIITSTNSSYALNKSYFPAYEALIDNLVQSRGDIVLDTSFSPSLVAWLILSGTLINKYGAKRFIVIDVQGCANRLLREFTTIPPNMRIITAIPIRFPPYAAFFLDGTLYDRSLVYHTLTRLWPADAARNTKKIIVASRNRLGDDLKSFYKIMGFDIFKEIFGDVNGTDADMMEQYNEVIRGYSLGIKIKPDQVPAAQPEGAPPDAAPAPPEAAPADAGPPPPPAAQTDEEIVLNAPIFYIEDFHGTTKKYMQTTPAHLKKNVCVLVLTAHHVPFSSEGNVVIYYIDEAKRKANKYALEGLRTADQNVKRTLYLRRVYPRGYMPNFGGALRWGRTYLKDVAFPPEANEDTLRAIYHELVVNTRYPFPEDMDVDKFIQIYRTYLEHAQQPLHITTIDNNNLAAAEEHARAAGRGLVLGRGLEFSRKSKAHHRLLKFGGAEVIDIYRKFNPTDVKPLMTATFIDGYPVFLTEFTS